MKSLDANTVADDVTNFCRQMIDSGVDALAVFGGDPTAMVDIASECDAAGIPLFLCALDVAEEGRESMPPPASAPTRSRCAMTSLST